MGNVNRRMMDSKVKGIDPDKIKSSIQSKVKSSKKLEFNEQSVNNGFDSRRITKKKKIG